MTLNTQSVCKHCGESYVDLLSRSCQKNPNGGYHEPVAEAASTGEPPHCSFCAEGNKPGLLGSGTGNYWHRLSNGELHKCDRNYYKERAARPSEPSAPQTSAEPIITYSQGSTTGATVNTGYLSAAAPQPVSGDAPKVEEIARKIMDEVRRRADNELDNMGAAEYEAILCPYFPPSPAHFSDCDYDCSCGWKKDPDSHLGAVRD